MRFLGATLTLLLALGLIAFSSGQQPRPSFRPGGGFQADPASLFRNPAVRKELGLSDEQLEKLPEAYLKALAQVLDKKQLTRLRQITLQQQGLQALADAQVQKELKFNDKQSASVEKIIASYRKDMKELTGDFKRDNFRERFEKMASLRKETNEKLEGVLTAEQKKSWQSMLGEEFKMPTFGQGNFGKKRERKKVTD